MWSAFGTSFSDAVNPWNGVASETDWIDSTLIFDTKAANVVAVTASSAALIVESTTAALAYAGYETTGFTMIVYGNSARTGAHVVYQVGDKLLHAERFGGMGRLVVQYAGQTRGDPF